MSKEAIIQATYADMKLVRTRSCAQLIFEIPIEQAPAAIEAFGVPLPGKEVWCAIARLDLTKAANEPASEGQRTARHWGQVKPPQQAGIRCDEKAFQRFLGERYDAVETTEGAAECVRDICGVSSRSDIGVTDESLRAWRELDGEYQFWLRNA